MKKALIHEQLKRGVYPAMRIENQQISGVRKAYVQQQAAAGTEKSRQKTEDDRINLSPDARLFSVALQAARDLPGNDEKKIEKISEALKTGSYYVKSADVAEKLWHESIFDKKV